MFLFRVSVTLAMCLSAMHLACRAETWDHRRKKYVYIKYPEGGIGNSQLCCCEIQNLLDYLEGYVSQKPTDSVNDMQGNRESVMFQAVNGSHAGYKNHKSKFHAVFLVQLLRLQRQETPTKVKKGSKSQFKIKKSMVGLRQLKSGSKAACIGHKESGINSNDQILILKIHNNLRASVALGEESRGNPGPQPPAGNMMQLEYDQRLARGAQKWADHCGLEHSNLNDPRFGRVGQTTFKFSGSPKNLSSLWQHVINRWYSGVEQFNKSLTRR